MSPNNKQILRLVWIIPSSLATYHRKKKHQLSNFPGPHQILENVGEHEIPGSSVASRYCWWADDSRSTFHGTWVGEERCCAILRFGVGQMQPGYTNNKHWVLALPPTITPFFQWMCTGTLVQETLTSSKRLSLAPGNLSFSFHKTWGVAAILPLSSLHSPTHLHSMQRNTALIDHLQLPGLQWHTDMVDQLGWLKTESPTSTDADALGCKEKKHYYIDWTTLYTSPAPLSDDCVLVYMYCH